MGKDGDSSRDEGLFKSFLVWEDANFSLELVLHNLDAIDTVKFCCNDDWFTLKYQIPSGDKCPPWLPPNAIAEFNLA